jgi:hypothetical protein
MKYSEYTFFYRWRQTTLNDPLEAAKTAWPVPYVEAIFLPEFKIKGNITEKDFQVCSVCHTFHMPAIYCFVLIFLLIYWILIFYCGSFSSVMACGLCCSGLFCLGCGEFSNINIEFMILPHVSDQTWGLD